MGRALSPDLIEGLSTDAKPTANTPIYMQYHETDTNDWYIFNGATWDRCIAGVVVGTTAPSNPVTGSLWVDTTQEEYEYNKKVTY